MVRTRRQIEKDSVNDYVPVKKTKKLNAKKFVVNPINIKTVAAGSNRKKRLLRNPIKIGSSSLTIKPKESKRTRIQEPKNNDNVVSRGSSTSKKKTKSRVPELSDSDSEDSGPSAPKKKKRNRIQEPTSSDNVDTRGSGASAPKKKKGTRDDTKQEPKTPPKKNRKNRSKVWFHFNVCFLTVDDIEGKYAKCKHCEKTYKVSDKTKASTGNLRRHLVKRHPEEWAKEEEPSQVFTQQNFREALLKWIVLSSQPFAVVEGDAFIELIKLLNPSATIVSNKTIRADLMEAYQAKVEEIAESLKGVPGKISVTLDIWTSKNVIPFLVIRAHWITAEWEYKTELLDFAYIPGDHSGKKQCRIFLKCMHRFGIPLSKILAFTMDNASSNGTFITCLQAHSIEMGLQITAVDNQVRCLAHILNLAVQDMLQLLNAPYMQDDAAGEETMDGIEEENDDSDNSDTEEEDEEETAVVEEEDEEEEDEEEESQQADEGGKTRSPTAKLRKLVRKIRKSTKLRQKLKKLCRFYKIKSLVPIIDVSTRWNSTYNMIKRAKHLHVPLTALCLNNKALSSLKLASNDWQQLETIEVLLQKFDRATKLISMERHETFCSYLPTLNWLLDVLTDYSCLENSPLAAAAHAGLTKLLKYELKVNTHKLPFVATVLNPALKMQYFTEHKYNQMIINQIKDSVSDYFTDNYETRCDTENIEEELEDELYAHIYKRSTPSSEVLREFEKYLAYPLSPPKVTDTLAFWKAQATDLPCLSRMARDFLAIQTTSVAVERDNSAGADLVTPSRCALLADVIQASMCMKRWFANEVVIERPEQ